MNDNMITMAIEDDLSTELFAPALAAISRPPTPQLSVSHLSTAPRRTDRLTDGLPAVVPGLIAQLVDRPIREIYPLEQYGRVIVVRVVPQAAIDPILPLVTYPHTAGYVWWYRVYWRRLLAYLRNFELPWLQRRMERARRRLVVQLGREGLTDAEQAYFQVWLTHGALGEYRYVTPNEGGAL